MIAVIAVIRRDPPRWRRGPRPAALSSPFARANVSPFVRLFVRRAAAMRTPNQQRQTGVRAVPRTLPRVPGIEIVRGCYVRANPLGPLLLEAGGPAAMTADYSSWRRRLLQCRLFVVRFDQRCGVRADRGSTCAVHTAGDMHHPPPGSSACLVLRIHSAGARSARQTARTAWHAPRGAVGKLFDGVISYSAHTVITLSARSHPQRQPWAMLRGLQTSCHHSFPGF